MSPQTLLRWHRQLASWKWARSTRRSRRRGRPPLRDNVRELILKIAKENPRWGYRRVHGELAKLGIKVSATAIRNLLRTNGHGPAPRADGPAGTTSYRRRQRRSLRPTSSPSRACSSSVIRCCSSSRSPPGASTSLAAPRTPTACGAPSRRATCSCRLTASTACAFYP